MCIYARLYVYIYVPVDCECLLVGSDLLLWSGVRKSAPWGDGDSDGWRRVVVARSESRESQGEQRLHLCCWLWLMSEGWW